MLLAYMNYAQIVHSYVTVDFSKFAGHSVTVDGSYSDWIGALPEKANSFWVDSGEFVYRDAVGDDTGDGDYSYPTDERFCEGMLDITQFRVTYDNNYLYIYVEFKTASEHPDGWWVNAVVIGMSDESSEDGNFYLIEGDGENPDAGPAAEIRTSFKIQYTVFASSTYRIRMWDWTGKKIGDGDDPDNSDGTMNNLKVKAGQWNRYEMAVPLSLIGGVSGKRIRFVVGSCFEENQMAREVQGYPLLTQWYITGGDRYWWNNLSSDPDVIDLIGADLEAQQEDLASYQDLFFSEEKFENFNVGLSAPIFSPAKGEKLLIYFTLSEPTCVTISLKDLASRLIRSVLQCQEVVPQSPYKTVIYEWDGKDNKGQIVDRGIYIVEVVFEKDGQRKTVRRLVRLW